MTEQDFTLIGIPESIKLFGTAKILRSEDGLPIVFLFDETHDNTESINRSIENAFSLIAKATVEIVGVESHPGGQYWDDYDREYRYGPINYRDSSINAYVLQDACGETAINNAPYLAEKVCDKHPEIVFGVESHGMSLALGVDTAGAAARGEDASADRFPLNRQRSEHFIRTLFEIRTHLEKGGNLILNCGSNHNTHINAWIEDNTIDQIAGVIANYVRISTL